MKDLQPIRRHRVFVTGVIVALFTLALFVTDLFFLLIAPLEVSSALTKADALVVFGGGLSPDGSLGRSTEERVRYTSSLYQQGLAEHVILSGGYRVSPNFEETGGMAELLVSLKVPRARILLDRRARNTFENASRVYEVCRREGFKTVILVTSPYHMQRALGCLSKYPLQVLAAPVPDSEVYRSDLDSRLRAFDLVIHEYGGLLTYWWKGWI
jgi:uncharacterized SAM-binding protein YcdF (DUF218 family)